MVAQAVRQTKFRGARPFEYRTDLLAVAHLLEEAFRSDHTFPFSRSPLFRELGVWLWTLNYAPPFPETLDGFVWIEDNRIVGNVTLGFDAGRSDRFYISNVAVQAEYRRQGIARALMETALTHVRTHDAHTVLLNVRPQNAGALQLYLDLGFKPLETRAKWQRAVAPRLPVSATNPRAGNLELAPLGLVDHRLVSELIRAATPEPAYAYRPAHNDFELSLEDQIFEVVADVCLGQSTRRWKLARAERLVAVLLVRGQRLFSPHHIALVAHPDVRGQIEDELAACALAHLTHFPARAIHAAVTGSHPEWSAALERHGFAFLNGLTLMELKL